jgi:lysine 2,3-aminomutase
MEALAEQRRFRNDSRAEADVVERLRDGAHARFDDEDFWRRVPIYEAVGRDEFLSYDFQTRHSLSNASPGAAAKLLLFVRERAGDAFAEDVRMGLAKAPMAVQITPYILSLINWDDPESCPIRIQFLPLGSRLLRDHPMLRLDSLGEKSDTKAPGLVHRYFDRVLFLPQATCPVYCRFCTRSYAIGNDTETVTKLKLEGTPKTWQKAFDYLRATPEVEDVVLSGGDSYNLHPRLLTAIAQNLLGIDSIRRVRIATKGLAVNPGRILTDRAWTDAVLSFAEKGRKLGKQIVVHTHVNTPEEITWVTKEAMRVLFEAGVVVRNQSVLLRGVNDSVYRMALLVKRLSYIQIQPYYVYQHDLVRGVEDLRTSLAQCLAIEHGVRGITAGFNTPQFVVDTPGGGGKRIASTYDSYDPETGVSVYTAPSVKHGESFLYFDPLHALDARVADQWSNPDWQQRALRAARVLA